VSVNFAVAAVLLGAVLLTADAVTTTDEERIEAFLEQVTESDAAHRIDAALTYADPERQPVDLQEAGERERYDEGESSALSEHARSLLSDLDKTNMKLVQDAIQIDDDRALVAIRARTGEGFIDVQFRLKRHEEDWLLTQVRVL